MPFTQGVEGSIPTGGTCPNDFSNPPDQDIRTQCALSWKIVVSEWQSVIAVSLNVGDGIRLIKLEKLYMCMQTHYKHDKDGRTAPCVRGHGSVLQSHLGNIVTRTGLYTHSVSCRTHKLTTACLRIHKLLMQIGQILIKLHRLSFGLTAAQSVMYLLICSLESCKQVSC